LANVARGSLLGIAAQAWHLLTAFFLYAFLARQLGPAHFGEWRVVLSVLAWFEIFLTSALIQVTTKALTERPAERPRIARSAYFAQSLVALAVFALVQLLAGPIGRGLSDPALGTFLRIAALDIPLYAIFMVSTSVLLGGERFERQTVSWIIYATAKFVCIAVLVAIGFSVEGALIGNALSSLVGIAAAFVPVGGKRDKLSSLFPVARGLALGSVPFLVLSLVQGVGQSADLWLVSAVVTNAVAVGWYASATVLAEVPVFLFEGLNRVVFPAVTRASAEGDHWLASRYAIQGVRLAVMVTALSVAVIAGTGREALTLLYSSAYVGAFMPLVILMGAGMGRTIRATCTDVLMATEQRRAALTILVGTIALEFVLLAILAPRYGLVGAAAAAAVAAVIGAILAAWQLRDMLGTRPVKTLARSAIAAVTVAFVLVQMQIPAPWLPIAYPAVALVFFGLLVLMREFDSDDIASITKATGRGRASA